MEIVDGAGNGSGEAEKGNLCGSWWRPPEPKLPAPAPPPKLLKEFFEEEAEDEDDDEDDDLELEENCLLAPPLPPAAFEVS